MSMKTIRVFHFCETHISIILMLKDRKNTRRFKLFFVIKIMHLRSIQFNFYTSNFSNFDILFSVPDKQRICVLTQQITQKTQSINKQSVSNTLINSRLRKTVTMWSYWVIYQIWSAFKFWFLELFRHSVYAKNDKVLVNRWSEKEYSKRQVQMCSDKLRQYGPLLKYLAHSLYQHSINKNVLNGTEKDRWCQKNEKKK